MKRILLMFLRNFFLLPYFFYVVVIKYRNTQKYGIEERYRWIRRWIHRINRSGRVEIACSGLVNLPKDGSYVMFPNHQGMYDVLAFLETHEKPFSVIMKIENEHVPLLRSVGRMLGVEYMDRNDIRQSLKVIQTMAKRVKDGENFIIFPEGTRSKKGNLLGEFKPGSFKSATMARCPIVPVALADSFKAFDTGSAKHLTVRIHYMEPLYYEDYKDMKSTDLAKLVETRVQAKVTELAEMQDTAPQM